MRGDVIVITWKFVRKNIKGFRIRLKNVRKRSRITVVTI